ncbi:MAG TPA: ATP-binding protein [Myxococcota bacterium]|nr:ATP-binding protein [Myxococcota bacterium]
MTHAPSSGGASSLVLPIATAAFAIAIFIVDSITPVDFNLATLYVVVVLMASRFCPARRVLLVALGCACLTVLGFSLSAPGGSLLAGITNMVISLAAIGLSAFLVVRGLAADARLREQAKLLDLTHDTVFSRDMDDTITFWNRSADELYGWKREEALGEVACQLLKKSFPVSIDEIMAELLRTDRWEGEVVHRKRDGTRVVVASRWSLQRDTRGRPVGIVETNNDITARKQAQEALQQAQANLERLNRVMLLGEMAASIVHEVNQPITGSSANASAGLRWLAAQPPEIEEARQALERIVRDANRASEVIGRVRSLAKKLPPHKSALNINDAVREVIALTQSELRRTRVILRTGLASGLPLVAADRVQLQQVVLNLIVNAIEAMSEVDERPRELSVVSGRSEPNDVFVEVRDSGLGLDPASLDHLFDSFYTTKPGGTGMGLAISRSIVEAHGGQLSAVPNEPYGAVFRFTLPLKDGAARDPVPVDGADSLAG